MQSIGLYRVLRKLGHGAFGAVFMALAPTGRQVAVKILTRDDPRARARFAREVETIRRLSHPGIVPLLDHGDEGGRPYFVMDYVQGQTFESLATAQRKLSPSRAAELVAELARAIGYAHDQGVLHRDLKPANVLVDTTGRVRVLDFGLASTPDSEERLSLSGQSLGTLAYMAPEQSIGKDAGPPTDVYGLGAVLYFLLCGVGPLDHVDNIYLALHRETPPAPSAHRTDVAPLLDAVCAQALAKRPERRFATAHELAERLETFLQGSDSTLHGSGFRAPSRAPGDRCEPAPSGGTLAGRRPDCARVREPRERDLKPEPKRHPGPVRP